LTNIKKLAESGLHQVMSLWKIGFNVACIATILWASVLPTAKAIYFANQEPPENYPFAGFLITELVNPPSANEKYLICGANFVSPYHVITAAHCVEAASSVAVSYGNFEESVFKKLGNYRINISEKYDPTMYKNNKKLLVEDIGAGDLALVHLPQPVTLEQYAQISKPTVGCNYYVVGYGKNEIEPERSYERRGIPACIDKVNPENLLISFPSKGFFCYGDSGSGLYRQGTNELVGIVSALNSASSCQDASLYVATRLDSNKNFFQTYLATDFSLQQRAKESDSLATEFTFSNLFGALLKLDNQVTNENISFIILVLIFFSSMVLLLILLLIALIRLVN